MDDNLFFLPEEVRALPDDSLQKSLGTLMLKKLWHSIYDFSPSVPTEHFESFLKYADQKQLPMDWMLHIHLLHWLQLHEPIQPNLVKELLIAAAKRWSLESMDYLGIKTILLASRYWPGYAVGVKKSGTAEAAGKIVILKLAHPADGYTLSTDPQWDDKQWLAWMGASDL